MNAVARRLSQLFHRQDDDLPFGEPFELTEEQKYRRHLGTDYRTCDKSCCAFDCRRRYCCRDGSEREACIHRRFEHHMAAMSLRKVVIELDANPELKAYAESLLEVVK